MNPTPPEVSRSAAGEGATCDKHAVVELWQARESDTPGDFTVGPGDVITISVPEIEELQKEQVRVAPDGTIGLPLVGIMPAAGMTENELRAAITQRLATYMKFPRVELFVERYQARDVAVMGAVQKPGLYDLSNSDQSIMDVIGLAGGMTNEAAQRVIFMPPRLADQGPSGNAYASEPRPGGAEPSLAVATNQGAASYLGQQHHLDSFEQTSATSYTEVPSRTHRGASLKGRPWIVLDLAKPGNQACLDVPVRPGDAVMVPIAGEVMVQGWVANPGAFKITPGMTLLGAVSAAGGATFSWTAALLRTDDDGVQTTTEYSLTQLQKGQAADVAVQSGDVVVVEKSAVGAVPYTFYEIFQHFGTGMGIPLVF
ncbi:MAG: polysaccharide biosynthesis/export family protein [Deltaproteobacteria bacterium]|nr:polysaccharide biosynthesis/export family protein [Deltaproteobacteria bacterium]